jgi:hypothetical protein
MYRVFWGREHFLSQPAPPHVVVQALRFGAPFRAGLARSSSLGTHPSRRLAARYDGLIYPQSLVLGRLEVLQGMVTTA